MSITQALVRNMLMDSGYHVYTTGFETLLQNLVQPGSNFNREGEVAQKIRSSPDFVVLKHDGEPVFVEVKFRANAEVTLDEIGRIRTHWSALIVIITIELPFFRAIGATDELVMAPSGRAIALKPLTDWFDIPGPTLRAHEDAIDRFLRFAMMGCGNTHAATCQLGTTPIVREDETPYA
ncbi:MAG: hypothetical protein V1778_04955 [bacterium]